MSNNEQQKRANLKLLLNDSEVARKLREEMNKDYVGNLINSIIQKRDLLKHLAILSGAILGLLSLVERPATNWYFFTGVGLILLVVVFSVLYLREVLDKEMEKLLTQQDNYNEIMDERIELIDKYLKIEDLTNDKIVEYLKELKTLSGTEALSEEVRDLAERRRIRLEKKSPLDFSGEFIVFLFVLGSFFISIYLFYSGINLVPLLLSIVFIFCVTFTDSFAFLMKYISKLISFLKKTKRPQK